MTIHATHINPNLIVCVHDATNDNRNKKIVYAYADIAPMEHQFNENGIEIPEHEQYQHIEETAFCRIYLLKNGEFLENWTASQSIRVQADKTLLETIEQTIEDAKGILMSWLNEKQDDLFEKAYEKYRLMWMQEHNFTMDDIINTLDEMMIGDIDDYAEPFASVRDAFEHMENVGGIIKDGRETEIWVCPDEFYDNEWNDEDCMREILDTDDFALWKSFQQIQNNK